MKPPDRIPIGLDFGRTYKLVSQAFDAALAEAGATLPVWLTLLSIKSRTLANQREHAAAIGIQGPTLTHHLNALETQGVLVRRRDPANRRVHQVELTEAGEAMFLRLRTAAMAFDKQLRAGLSEEDLAKFAGVLATLRANIGQ
jgi:MarR family transcriptional regulator, transcriptional regulator for hemolysin